MQKISDAVSDFQKKSAELDKAVAAEKAAKEKISAEEILLKKYEATILKREQEIENLQGAEGNFKDAEQNLKLAQDKNKRLQEIETLKKNLSDKQNILKTAEKNYTDAYKKVERLRHLQREGAAAFLAENLADGEPCPVCGATHHPDLAKSATLIPSDEEIEQAEIFLKRRELEQKAASDALAASKAKIDSAQSEVEKFAEVLKLSEAQKICDAAQENLNKFNKAKKNLRDGKNATQLKS